jgi:aldehyde:ferredoxin oxidoreductase
MYARDERDMRSISVVSAGQAADHVAMPGLNISFTTRAAKKSASSRPPAAAAGGCCATSDQSHRGALQPDERRQQRRGRYGLLRKAGQRINKEITDFDAVQNDMRNTGTPYLVEIMDRFDLLPVENFRYGAHPDHKQIGGRDLEGSCSTTAAPTAAGTAAPWPARTRAALPPAHRPYRAGVMVDGPEYETLGALGLQLRHL